MSKVLVFGGNGFLGSHIAEQMQSQHAVTVAVRSSGATEYLQTLKTACVCVDTNDTTKLATHMQGYDVVVNCTANVHPHLAPEAYCQTHVTLTQSLATAAQRAGVGRFLQLSTIKVYSDAPTSAVVETYARHPHSALYQSLAEREQVLANLAARTGLDVVTVQPAAALGRRDRVLSTFIDMHNQGYFSMIGDGTVPFSAVDARDVGRAFSFLADYAPATGHTYLLQGYQTSWAQIKAGLDELRGQAAKVRTLPPALASVLGYVLEAITPYGKAPFLTRSIVHSVLTPCLANDAKLRATGFAPRYDFTETIAHLYAPHCEDNISSPAQTEAMS